jgi:hypothetical protein
VTTYYHPTKDAALETATALEADSRVAAAIVQFEPYNGWVVVLIPARYDLSDLAGQAEIQDGTKRPSPLKNRPTPLSAPAGRGAPKGGPDSPSTAPVKGATAMVWTIADGVGKPDRTAIIAACVASGINAATAATQYSKWKKAKGF